MAWKSLSRSLNKLTAPSQGKAPTTRRRPPNSPSTRSHRGEGQATRDQARGCHCQGPEHQRRRRWERQGGNRQDLTDRQERRRGSIDCDPSQRRTPTELVGIERGGGGATQSSGLGREWRKKRARGYGRSVWPKPPGRVRPGRPAPTGGPGPTGGLGLAGDIERGLNQI
jgi:hypothetical protein